MGITPPPAPSTPTFSSNNGKQKNYIWMPDKNGNLVKTDAATAKKSFATLSTEANVKLTEYLLAISNKQPTASARQNLWNDIVDGAIAAFKDGKKQSPWDVLDVMTQNSPAVTGVTTNLIKYDRIASDATLNKIAKSMGFDVSQLTEQDRVDFLNKINEEAGQSGKSVTRKAEIGGYETVTTPSIFDPKTFTEAFIWAKVNVGDTKTLPSSAIKQVANVNTLLKNYGINNLSTKEINQLAIDVASGVKTLDDLTLSFSEKAQKLYPVYADRLKANPKLTMSDIAEPIISTLSKVWEMDPTQFTLSDPNVSRFLIPDVTGKKPEASIADVYNYAMNHPNREKTKAANDEARDAAVGVARAMGFGI